MGEFLFIYFGKPFMQLPVHYVVPARKNRRRSLITRKLWCRFLFTVLVHKVAVCLIAFTLSHDRTCCESTADPYSILFRDVKFNAMEQYRYVSQNSLTCTLCMGKYVRSNAFATEKLYSERFPNTHHPSRQVFISLDRDLLTWGPPEHLSLKRRC